MAMIYGNRGTGHVRYREIGVAMMEKCCQCRDRDFGDSTWIMEVVEVDCGQR